MRVKNTSVFGKMGLLVILLSAMMLCTGCEKHADAAVPNDPGTTTSVPGIVPADNPVSTEEKASIQETGEPKSIQEIMEECASTAPGVLAVKRKLFCYIEGNFTNSGRSEFSGFFMNQDRNYSSTFIDSTFCFLFDPNSQSIEKSYIINYIVIEFDAGEDADTYGLTEVLGRPVYWRETKIGYVGDFNENGKEELYLVLRSGSGFYPVCYEFEESEFIKIVDIGTPVYAAITSVDPEKKILNFTHFNNENRTRSYIWNKETQVYEEIKQQE